MSRISIEKFLNHSIPNHFVEELFCAVLQKKCDSEKVYGKELGGSIEIYLRKYFVSQYRKSLQGTHLWCVLENFW